MFVHGRGDSADAPGGETQLDVDPGGLSDSEVTDTVVDLFGLLARVDAAIAGLVGELDRRGLHQLDGSRSAASWLAHRCRLAPGEAASRVRVARRLRDMPVAARAFEAGEVHQSHVAVLARAWTAERAEPFAAVEDSFVNAARSVSAPDLQRLVDRWADALDGDQARDRDADRYGQRRLHLSHTFDGQWAMDGLLTPDGGSIVERALNTAIAGDGEPTGPLHRHPDGAPRRTWAQRRHDALVDMARHYLATHNHDGGSTTPEVSVVLDYPVLCGLTGRAEVDDGTPLSAEAARRLACDSAITRIITGGASMPLDVGRATRSVPPGLRRALTARDRHCRFTGCDAPAARCQAHHIVHWARNGHTDMANLVLLCWHHHHLVHEAGFTITLDPTGHVHCRRPDGTPIPP